MDSVFIIQLTSCFFMTGLIWTIQLVHYPSFHFVDPNKDISFTQFHVQRITPIVLPVMVVELFSAAWLAYFKPNTMTVLNFALVILIWLSTFFFSVPLHSKLALNYESNTISKLVKTNWPRTLLWSVRSIGLLYLILNQEGH